MILAVIFVVCVLFWAAFIFPCVRRLKIEEHLERCYQKEFNYISEDDERNQ